MGMMVFLIVCAVVLYADAYVHDPDAFKAIEE